MDSGWQEGTCCACGTHPSRLYVDFNSFQVLFFSLTLPFLSALFSSKEGAAQVRLKIGLENDNNGHNFTFTSAPPVALTEREMFKAQLTTIISNNRAAHETGAVQPPQAGVPISTSSSNGAVRRAPVPAPSRPSDSRAESVSSHRGTPVNDPINDFHVRKKVLLNTPELAALHRELVMSGQITETEFWEGREVCETSTHDTPYLT
jgi:transcription initiation factor TFIIH subunit 1